METFISVTNWEEMQHYKDRSPPWIKMHSVMLESYEFECLPDASKAHLICIMLLASRTNNKIQADPKWIKRKIGANDDIDLNLLLKSGFLQSNQPLAEVEQDASKMLQGTFPQKRERESREREEREVEKDTSTALTTKVVDNVNNDTNVIFDYWCKAMGKSLNQCKLTPKRKSVIKARLKDYPVIDIEKAIYNCSKSDFHMGNNNNGTQYNDIELICRNGEKLETFRDMTTMNKSDVTMNKHNQDINDFVNNG